MVTQPAHDAGLGVGQPASAGVAQVLQGLVQDGTLTEAQAHAVLSALAPDRPAPQAAAAASRPPRRWGSRLAEIGGYLGAALVAAAAAIVVGQQWDAIGQGGQLALMSALVLVFGGSALILIRLHGATWALGSATDSVWRRLSSTLLTLAAGALAVAVLVAMLPPETESGTDDAVGRSLVVAAVGAIVVLGVARWMAPSAFADVALFVATIALVGGFWLDVEPSGLGPVAISFCLLGVGWALASTWASLASVPTLGAAIGLAFGVFSTTIGGDSATMNPLLGVMVLVGIGVYAMRPTWPYLAAAMVSTVGLTISLFGAALGPAFALLAAGVVLMVFAGGILYLQRRRGAERPAA